jgi:hypothetical protein
MYSYAVKFSRLVLYFFLSLSLIVAPARASDVPTSADTVSLFYDPDFPLPAGQTLASFYASKRYLYVYREIVPLEGGGNTFFNMLGSNAGDYPEFFGGIQTFKDGRPNAAIFSAWDTAQTAHLEVLNLPNKLASLRKAYGLKRDRLAIKELESLH